jgi:hypothetical protein
MIKIDVDTDDLAAFAKRLENADKLTKPLLASGLNEIGDSLVALIATDVSKKTGLNMEEVRGLMRVTRANRNDLSYDVTLKSRLVETPKGREVEPGNRESKDFGKRQPGELVVIVTAKDDLVCMDCAELEAAGPMPVEIANEHIPKHPHCRCVIMPYVQKGKRLPVTMTTLTGTDPKKRTQASSSPLEDDLTLRQLVQRVVDRSATHFRVELMK